MNLRYLALAMVFGCGAKPNLAGDGGPTDAPSLARLAITPKQADVTIGAPTVLTIANEGDDTTGPIGLEIMGTDSPSFSIGNSSCSVLVAHASCTVSVRLTPRATGALTARLHAFDGATDDSADLTATSTNALIIIPPGTGFASTAIDNDSPPAIYTVRNNGAATTGKLTMSVEPTSPQFTFVHQMDNCTGTSLAMGGECTVALAFSPRGATAPLTRSGTLSARDPSGASATRPLMATVGRLAFTISTSGTIGGSACAAPPGSVTFNFTNETWKPLTMFTYQLTGSNSSSFTTSTTCVAQPAAGSTCAITVSQVTTDGTGPSGTLTAMLVVDATEDNASSAQMLSLGASLGSCDLLVMPESITFPSLATGIGSAPQSVTVQNNGTIPHIIAAMLGGLDPGDFAITSNTCTNLMPTQSCTIGVTAKPMLVGNRTGTLAITTPGLAPPPVTLTVQGLVP